MVKSVTEIQHRDCSPSTSKLCLATATKRFKKAQLNLKSAGFSNKAQLLLLRPRVSVSVNTFMLLKTSQHLQRQLGMQLLLWDQFHIQHFTSNHSQTGWWVVARGSLLVSRPVWLRVYRASSPQFNHVTKTLSQNTMLYLIKELWNILPSCTSVHWKRLEFSSLMWGYYNPINKHICWCLKLKPTQ